MVLAGGIESLPFALGDFDAGDSGISDVKRGRNRTDSDQRPSCTFPTDH